jgi:hypothetical protein
MQDILIERAKLIDSAEQATLDRIPNTRRRTRERAIKVLTEVLDPTSEKDNVIFQTLPLEFLERGDVIWAIWYIETVGKLGKSIPLEVIQQVVEQAIDDRAECEELGDEEALHVLDTSIFSLFRMAQSHPDFLGNAELSLIIWCYEEFKWDLYKAIPNYDKAIEQGNIDWYF